MIESGTNWNELYGAYRGGHIEIVKLMIECSANDWNGGLGKVCRSGNIEIVKLMIEHGTND